MIRLSILCALGWVGLTCVPAAGEVGIGVRAGQRVLDPGLGDYRWETGPATVLGLEGFARRQEWDLAVDLERSSTRQATGLPGERREPRVALASTSLRLGRELLAVRGVRVGVTGAVGWLHLDWSPDRLAFEVEGLAEPVVVDYAPIDTWERTFGLRADWSPAGPMTLGLLADWSWFALDTAHRAGAEIVEARETFSSFDLALRLRWSFTAPMEVLP